MNNREADILLIRRYLDGKLDAHAMHQLERRAEADPFLMDAMEGYESTPMDQQNNIADLSRRLNQRIISSEKRLIPWRYIAAAASVIVVLGIGGSWLYLHQPSPKPATAVNISPVAASAPPVAKQADVKEDTNPVAVSAQPVLSRSAAGQPRLSHGAAIGRLANNSLPIAKLQPETKSPGQKADTTPVDEMVVIAMQDRKKKDAESIVSLPDAKVAKPVQVSSDQPLKSKVDGVSITNLEESEGGSRYYTARIVQGRVIEQSDGQPMPGVTIRVKGTSIGTQTDANGSFKLPSGSKDKTLIVGYLGYQTQEVPASKLDSTQTLAMVANNGSSLNEVTVAAGAPEKSKQSNTDNTNTPHPKAGWDSYNKYLEEKAISPDKATGTVQLSFTVSPAGAVTDIHVIKSLSMAADKKAAELINNGPPWTGGANRKATEVKISITFAGH